MPPSSPKLIQELATRLDLHQAVWHPNWSFPFHRYSPQTDEHETAWLDAELTIRPQIDELVRQWLSQAALPQMADESLYWFKLRFRAAADLLHLLVLDDGTTIFSVGQMMLDDLLRWTLLEWWAGRGRCHALYEIIKPDFGPQINRN